MKIDIKIFYEDFPHLKRVIFDMNPNVWIEPYKNTHETCVLFIFRPEHHNKTARLYNFLSKYNAEFVPLEL